MPSISHSSSLLGLASLTCAGLLHAANLTVSPTSVSDTYQGTVTITLSGLTNGEPVLLEKFQDANGNGGVDAGEPMVASYRLTDGQVASIGGVRNQNVPGDDDLSADGQITVGFNFRASVEFERAIGPYVYRLSSPTGRFAPVTKTFAVTATAYPQSVSGTVTNSSGLPVPYAGVGVLNTGDGEFVTGGGANAAGAYSFTLPPGTYQLVPLQSGYVADLSSASPVTLGAGQHLSANLGLVSGNRTLSGRVRDAQTGTGLAGMQLFCQSDSGGVTIGFSDAAGNFSMAVWPGFWTLEASEAALALRGYPSPRSGQTNDLTLGDVSNVMIDLTRGTSLVYGTVKDSQGLAVSGLSAFCSSQQQPLEGNGITDANGNFWVAAGPGGWWFGFSDEALARLGLLVQGTNFTLNAGQALRVDFTASHATAHLRGVVRDTQGVPVTDILMVASANNSHTSARSGGDGSFDLPVFGGTWQLSIEGSDAGVRGFVSPQLQVPVTEGVDVNGVLVIALPITAQISGRVTNSLGQAEAGLNLYVFTTVNGTNYNANASTDAGGNYSAAVANATWHVGIPCDQVTPRGYLCPPEQLITVSGVTRVANFALALPTPPSLGSPTIVGRQFHCTVTADPGVFCRVRYTSDFINWYDLASFTGPSFELFDPLPLGAGHRFYRVEVGP